MRRTKINESENSMKTDEYAKWMEWAQKHLSPEKYEEIKKWKYDFIDVPLKSVVSPKSWEELSNKIKDAVTPKDWLEVAQKITALVNETQNRTEETNTQQTDIKENIDTCPKHRF